MNEIEAYRWAYQALRPLSKSGCELHRWEQVTDLVASAISEAYKKGHDEGARGVVARGSGETVQIRGRRAPSLSKGG